MHQPQRERYGVECQACGWRAQMPGLEVWFQRASDVVRKLMYGDVDIGIVGYDMFAEIADQDPGLVVLHDALKFGRCLPPSTPSCLPLVWATQICPNCVGSMRSGGLLTRPRRDAVPVNVRFGKGMTLEARPGYVHLPEHVSGHSQDRSGWHDFLGSQHLDIPIRSSPEHAFYCATAA